MSTPDNNYRSYANQTDVKIVAEEISPPSYFVGSDTVHFSRCKRIDMSFCIVTGLKEDCVDLNNECDTASFHGCDFHPTGKYGFTIKGGTRNVEISNSRFFSHGSEYDIDIGNWSDQSDQLTTGIVLRNVTAQDDKPVRVRVLWGEPPLVIGGNVKVTVYPKIIVKIYRWLRARNLVK